MYTALVLVLGVSFLVCGALPSHVCPRGTHLLQVEPDLEVCQHCEEGKTYMSDDWHTNLECFSCTQLVDPRVEIKVGECNRTHDTLIHCKEGYYRRKARNIFQSDLCVKCMECKNPTRLCEGFHDTVCCGHPNYEAFLNEDNVYICREKPVSCTKGEFYDPHYNQCFTCPPSTFMSNVVHNNIECKPCEKLDNNSSKIVLQPCNSTLSAVFACKPGYFKQASQELSLSDGECLPCRTCQFVGRSCTQEYDAVCCDSSDMKVIDSSTGPVCVPLRDISESSVAKEATDQTITSDSMEPCGNFEFITFSNSVTCLCHHIEDTHNSGPNPTKESFDGCFKLRDRQLLTLFQTENHVKNTSFRNDIIKNICSRIDITRNTISGISINRIPYIISLICATLVPTAYSLLTLRKAVSYQPHTCFILLCAVYLHMFVSYNLRVFATDATVVVVIVTISTCLLSLVVFCVLYRIKNQIIGKDTAMTTGHRKVSLERNVFHNSSSV